MRNAAVLLGAVLLLIPARAHALVQVVGSGLAHDCYLMAKMGNDPRGGIATCDEALAEEALNPQQRAGTYVNRAVMKVALGRVDDAMRDYDEGLRIKPDLGDGYVDRGAALITLKRYDEAMADINKGIGLGLSFEHLGYYDRAVAEFYMGRIRESYFDYKKTLEIAPDFAPAQAQLKNFTVTRVPAGAKE
ncbi:MAG TPA: tetratricopeptide repeat protein [Rhizomicrobium sp.]|nr:tetratricopeptide repeat protein [Rhizomicrobium sp.]